ncbi:MAG: hypothetical protein K0Q70_1818 [Rhodospirillales bacterium]|jgi:hypothetical protein|nr:hypothetical protein [Rhodospirillales bacterium]
MKKTFFAVAFAALILSAGTVPSTPVAAQEKGKSAESKSKADTKGKSADMGKDHEKQSKDKDKKEKVTKQQAAKEQDKGGNKNKK